jgi:hypothetical protein
MGTFGIMGPFVPPPPATISTSASVNRLGFTDLADAMVVLASA